MDPVVPGLKLPPLREVEIAEAKVVEAQRAWIHRPELLHGLSAPFSRGPHGRDQLADRFTRRRPHHRRRVRRPRRIGRERRERREVGRPRRERPPSRGLPRELRGELARRDLGERQMVDDLADRPNLRARFPVRLALGEPLHFSEDLGAHGLELVPQSLHGLRKAHRGTPGQYTPGRSGYFADARTIGPVGAGTPPSGSSVTAKTFTGLPPSTGSTRCVARPSASTRKTPAGLGAPSPIVHNSYALLGGGGGRFATKSWRPTASGRAPARGAARPWAPPPRSERARPA